MTSGERVRIVRKELGLTLETFGNKIGMKKNSVSQIENNVNNLTEQNIKAICREYNVDYIWLTTGKGSMFAQKDNDYLFLIEQIMAGENEFAKNIFKMFTKFSEDDWVALHRLIQLYIDASEEKAH